nr:hypothetical protein [Aeromonas dhakensis]
MNRTTSLLLPLLLVAGAALAAPQYEEEGGTAFSVDALTFNLDWDDKQFGWSSTNCFEPGMNDGTQTPCQESRVSFDDEEHRNDPPGSNQMPATQGTGQ